jgi:hypothetical protein
MESDWTLSRRAGHHERDIESWEDSGWTGCCFVYSVSLHYVIAQFGTQADVAGKALQRGWAFNLLQSVIYDQSSHPVEFGG